MNWRNPKVVPPADRKIIETDEVFALLEYATRNKLSALGDDAHYKIICNKVDALSKAIKTPENNDDVATRYAALVNETSPVNGRTILDSTNNLQRLRGIGTWTLLFFVLAAGNHVADAWLAESVTTGAHSLFIDLKIYLWDYLTPFFWGCLGACVFLLKKIQDLAGKFEYEHARLQGTGTRMLLGGILAEIMVTLTTTQTIGNDVTVTVDTIAFLTGLSVKVVYSALESTIESLAEKFKRNPKTALSQKKGEAAPPPERTATHE